MDRCFDGAVARKDYQQRQSEDDTVGYYSKNIEVRQGGERINKHLC